MLLWDTGKEHSITHCLLTVVNILMLTPHWKVKQHCGLKASRYLNNAKYCTYGENEQYDPNLATSAKLTTEFLKSWRLVYENTLKVTWLAIFQKKYIRIPNLCMFSPWLNNKGEVKSRKDSLSSCDYLWLSISIPFPDSYTDILPFLQCQCLTN